MDRPPAAEPRPLAETMRPQDFAGILGQDKIWGPEAPLRRLVASDRFFSLLFWGPPGTGKTSTGLLVGKYSQREVIVLSAVSCGVRDIRAALDASCLAVEQGKKKIILFIDEIHRLSKNQQDVLLPALEKGDVKFIGATTENPSFTVINAILSRSLVFRFEPIPPAAMVEILRRALGAAIAPQELTGEHLNRIAAAAGGDARRALNVLDAILAMLSGGAGGSVADLDAILDSMALPYDKKGDHHYDTISALIKSVRGSHPDAALHYLARAIAAGEDVGFLARRLIILAAEDIGNANPHALTWAVSAAQAVQMIGMPEARIILGQMVTLLASSPKSNRSYVGIESALADIAAYPGLEIPLQLRNAPTQLMKNFGYGKDYAYAHDDREGARQMEYLPKEIAERKYYQPGDAGYEVNIRQTLERLRPRS